MTKEILAIILFMSIAFLALLLFKPTERCYAVVTSMNPPSFVEIDSIQKTICRGPPSCIACGTARYYVEVKAFHNDLLICNNSGYLVTLSTEDAQLVPTSCPSLKELAGESIYIEVDGYISGNITGSDKKTMIVPVLE